LAARLPATSLLFVLGGFAFPTWCIGAAGRLAAKLAALPLHHFSHGFLFRKKNVVAHFSASGILLDPAKLVPLVFSDKVIKI
jgi:hypothetical protein